MSDVNIVSDDCLKTAQGLVTEIQSGNEKNANNLLDELVSIKETILFSELGKLTREFHDALTNFRQDSKISELTETDIPDARDRLNHVIKMTNDSADSTLNAVENAIPACDKLLTETNDIKESWARFQRKEMQADEFRLLSEKITQYLDNTINSSSGIKVELNSILMAQTFQDLTGQIIKQVITLVDEVESNLVNLVKLSSKHVAVEKQSKPKDSDSKAATSLDGPQIPGKESNTAVSGQDEVDDLLSSLGF